MLRTLINPQRSLPWQILQQLNQEKRHTNLQLSLAPAEKKKTSRPLKKKVGSRGDCPEERSGKGIAR